MARLTPDQWREARADYEVRLLTFEQIGEKLGINKSNISRRAKQEGWDRNEKQEIVQKKVNALIELKSITQQTQQMPLETQLAIKEVADVRLKIAEGDQCSAEIYALTRKRGLKIAQDQDGDLNELMRLMTVGNEAVKTTVKMIEINGKTVNTETESIEPKLTIIGNLDRD
jgi:hypothetical protein